MTLKQIEQIVADQLKWLVGAGVKLRPDTDIHIAMAIYQALARESGEEAEHHANNRYWNASGGQYDEGGCW